MEENLVNEAPVGAKSRLDDLKVTEQMRDNLLRSMNWMMFFAVIGCAGMVLLLIVALVMLAASAFLEMADGGIMLGVGLFYILMVAVYVYPLKKSFALIKNTREAMNGIQDKFEQTTDDLFSMLKYCGIMTIIMLVLYIPFIILILLIGSTLS